MQAALQCGRLKHANLFSLLTLSVHAPLPHL